MDLPVINKAIGGRSARSYTVEGRFQDVSKLGSAGDWVVIEFGHNDGGSLNSDNGRSDCPKDPTGVCTGANGATVQTFTTYMSNAGNMFSKKGMHVIISSQTPNNPWETGSFVNAPSRFVDLAKKVAGLVEGAVFIDHFAYVNKEYQAHYNPNTIKDLFAGDHTHTNAKGAKVVAKAFSKGVACAKTPLTEHVRKGAGITCS